MFGQGLPIFVDTSTPCKAFPPFFAFCRDCSVIDTHSVVTSVKDGSDADALDLALQGPLNLAPACSIAMLCRIAGILSDIGTSLRQSLATIQFNNKSEKGNRSTLVQP